MGRRNRSEKGVTRDIRERESRKGRERKHMERELENRTFNISLFD